MKNIFESKIVLIILLIFVTSFTALLIFLQLFVKSYNANAFPTAIEDLSMQSFAENAPFYYTKTGDVYIVRMDCRYSNVSFIKNSQKLNLQFADKVKLEGIKASDVEVISNQFIRAKGKIYDVFYSEFTKLGMGKMNNLPNTVDVDTFKYLGDDDYKSLYFQDRNGIYCYKGYWATSPGCIDIGNEQKTLSSNPISYYKIDLQSPEEIQLYLGQKKDIFIAKNGMQVSSGYASLDGVLYWRNLEGKYNKISGASPENFKLLSPKNLNLRELYTNEQEVFLNGEIVGVDPKTFQEVKYFLKKDGAERTTAFFKANSAIYYLASSYPYPGTSVLLKTEADFETFEVLNTNDSLSGLVFQDKNYLYSYSFKYPGDEKKINKNLREK